MSPTSENMFVQCLNEYPLKLHFYIEKQGFAGVSLIFLFLIQNIHCRYSLELTRRGGSNVYHNVCFELTYKKKNIFFQLNFHFFFFFSSEKRSLYIAWASFCNGIKIVPVNEVV